MADSRAYMPGASPGARIQDGVGTSNGTTRCSVRLCGTAYMTRAGVAACSTNSFTREVCVVTSCTREASRPSASAPRRSRCRVGARCPTAEGRTRRGRATVTGRPVCRVAITASTTSGRGVPLDPKPPPTCSATTEIRS